MTEPDRPVNLPHDPGPRRGGAAARRWATDAAIAIVVIAIEVGATSASARWHHGQATAGIATYVLLAIGGASLIARRRYPVGVLAVTLAVAIWPGVASQAHLIWLALIVAFFTAVQARQRAAAIAALVGAGGKRVLECAIAGPGPEVITPCGGCRQKLREFASDLVPIHLCSPEGLRQTVTLGDLLPMSFGPDHLKNTAKL